MTGDSFIKLGFWSQLVLLALVDWGSIRAFMNEPVPPERFQIEVEDGIVIGSLKEAAALRQPIWE